MESIRKRRGSIKAKLVGLPFYKAAKPASNVQYNGKATPTQQASKTTGTVGFVVHQEYVVSQPKPKVSFVIPENNLDPFAQFDKVFTYPGDEAVDLKAAKYISSVQERFKLEQIN